MSSPLDVLDARIDEYRQARAAKAAELRDLDAKIEALLSLRPDMEAASKARRISAGGETGGRRATVPVRKLLNKVLEEHWELTPAEAVAFVIAKCPEAREPSIRSEWSRAKQRGDITAIGDGRFRSNQINPFYSDGDEETGEDPPGETPDAGEGDDYDGPPAGFGAL